jgi:hypothetical protein
MLTMNVSLKYVFLFVISSFIAFYALSLLAYPFTHPYFKGTVFYAIELPLIVLAILSVGFAKMSRKISVAVAGILSGYLVSFISCLIKWAFFDGRSTHVARAVDGIFDLFTWIVPILAYGWILLPISLLIGRWFASRFAGYARQMA